MSNGMANKEIIYYIRFIIKLMIKYIIGELSRSLRFRPLRSSLPPFGQVVTSLQSLI